MGPAGNVAAQPRSLSVSDFGLETWSLVNDWNNWNFGTLGTAGTTGPGLLRGLKKGNKKILTGTSVPLDTCLLMGDPLPPSG
jgi:hypothetical protein